MANLYDKMEADQYAVQESMLAMRKTRETPVSVQGPLNGRGESVVSNHLDNTTSGQGCQADRVDKAIGSAVSGVDLLKMVIPEPTWVIPEYLPTGLAFLAGKSKLGKSWLALQIACAKATGGTIFGQQITPGKVLYLALEDNARRMQSRMRVQMWPDTFAGQFDIHFWGGFSDNFGSLNKGGSEILYKVIEQAGYDYVVIDTFSRAIAGDQSDVAVVTPALAPLHQITQEIDCCIQIVDHHNKGGIGDPIGDVLGSTAKGAVADTMWGLYRERGKTQAQLSILGRDLSEQKLELDMAWDIGTWQLTGIEGERPATEGQQALIDVLAEIGPSSCATIAKAVDKPDSNVYRELQELLNKRLVDKDLDSKRYYLTGSI